jgi:hypothetical protein
MKITFISSKPNLRRGSYPIWIHNAAKNLEDLGCDIEMNGVTDLPGVFASSDVILVDKEDLHCATEFPKNRNCAVGAINPPHSWSGAYDFAIVGSMEEQISLSSQFEQLYLSPLVEDHFWGKHRAPHHPSTNISIGYHGNSRHLASMESLGLTSAIEAFARQQDAIGIKVSLTIMSEKKEPIWRVGKPRIPIHFHEYDIDALPHVFSRVDIGIVPNAHIHKPSAIHTRLSRRVMNFDFNQSDIIMRFKSKSNYGRALVFMQLGIPVIADFTPSHLSLIKDGINGYLAANHNSWLKALSRLSDPAQRNIIADTAKSAVKSEFSARKCALSFKDFLITAKIKTRLGLTCFHSSTATEFLSILSVA